MSGKPSPKDDEVARLKARISVIEQRLGIDGTPAKRKCHGCGSTNRPLEMTHHQPGPGFNIEIRPKCRPCQQKPATSSPASPPSSSSAASSPRR